MNKPLSIAVLASTKGTDLQAIMDRIKDGSLRDVELAAVLSNKECYALERAKGEGYTTHFIDPAEKSPEEFDQKIAAKLEEHNVDLVVLVGYMKILSPWFVRKFKNRIINVHPALLPKFGGKEFFGNNVHKAVLEAGETETGMTIHFVDEGVDTGKIILQKKVTVASDETPETLKTKVQELEKEWYPKVLQMFADGEVS
jgi:phosphoribosylglycinamide formyltransferase 1